MGDRPNIKHRPLTPVMKAAARLDAQGMSINDVVAQIGVSKTAYKDWRTRDDWIAQRDEYGEQMLREMQPALNALRFTAIDAHTEALTVAMEALKAKAVGEENTPNWPVRMQGATLIMNSPIVKGMVDSKIAEKDPAPGRTAPGGGVIEGVRIMISVDEDGKRHLSYGDEDETIDVEGEQNAIGPGADEGDDPAEDIEDADFEPVELDSPGDPDF